MLTNLENDLVKAGWARCTNNDARWYPAWGGKRGPRFPFEAQVRGNQIVVVDGWNKAASPVAEFNSPESLGIWCDANGISSNEIGPYNGPWD